MSKRKTTFRWFTNKTRKKLTIKAKKWLSKKLKEYHKKKKPPPSAPKFFRYSAFKIWTIEDDEDYYPQLEIKAHIFSVIKLDEQLTKVNLNYMINKAKKDYDFNEFFHFELTRRRIAYEAEQISREEFQFNDVTILTVNDDIDTIRKGFPVTRTFS